MKLQAILRPLCRGTKPCFYLALALIFMGLSDCPDSDGDGDGYSPNQGDCDDANPETFPGAAELCDTEDNDCDGVVDEDLPVIEFLRDADDDGFGGLVTACVGSDPVADCGGDCNDDDPSVHPGADDPSDDGIDQDCGGSDGAQPHVGLASSSLDTIQGALDAAADGDTVWVGPGTYLEHDLSFNGKALVLESTCGAESTVVDATGLGRVMVFENGEGSESVVRGLTLTGGFEPDFSGGGVLIESASPALESLIIRDNAARGGGAGVALAFSSSVVRNCRVVANTAGGSSYSGLAGGLYAYESDLEVIDSQFSDNLAGDGGGAFLDHSSMVMTRALFENNKAIDEDAMGGGMAVYLSYDVEIRDSVFRGNHAGPEFSLELSGEQDYIARGGGLYIESTQQPRIIGCTFADNYAATWGGGICLGGADAVIALCEVSGNETGYYSPPSDVTWPGSGGGLFAHYSNPSISNSHFSENVAHGLVGEGGGIGLNNSNLTISNSVLERNVAGGYQALGGGVFAELSSIVADHTLFAENTAAIVMDSTGGALYLEDSSAGLAHCIIRDNAAPGEVLSWAGALYGVDSEVSIDQTAVTGNYCVGSECGVLMEGGALRISNSILAYNMAYNLYVSSTTPADVMYTDLYVAPGMPMGYNHNLTTLDSSNLEVEPGFLEYRTGSTGIVPSNFHLGIASPMVDRADPALLDADETRADMGAFGGEGGAGWDLDADTYPDYFWPGTIFDAPPGIDPGGFDCDDRDPEIHTCP